jgi:hypothetical protein
MENDFGGAAMQEQKQKQKQKQEEKQPRYFTRPALRGWIEWISLLPNTFWGKLVKSVIMNIAVGETIFMIAIRF